MQLPPDSLVGGLGAGGLRTSSEADAALAVLACVRALMTASQHVLARLRDTGTRARLGRLGDRCADVLETLERALEEASGTAPAAMGARRVPHAQRSAIDVGGAGSDLCLLLELDVLAARLQARIDGLLVHGTPPRLREPLRTLHGLVRQIRAEYELYAA